MSWKRQDQVWHIDGLPASEKFVLLALAHFENEVTNQCYPSYASISKITALTSRSVKRAIKNLKRKGFVTSSNRKSEYGDKGSNEYRFLNTSSKQLSPGGDTVSPPGDNYTGDVVTSCHDVVTDSHQGGDTKTPGVVTLCHPNREDITKNKTENITEKKFTTTTKPSPPPQPTGGGGDAPAANFFHDDSDEAIVDDAQNQEPADALPQSDTSAEHSQGNGETSKTSERDAYHAWQLERKLEAVRLHGSLSEDLNEGIGNDHLLYFLKMIEIQHPQFVDGHESDIFDVIKAVYLNHGLDDTGAPIEDLISYLCDLVLGKRACFGIKINPPPKTENAQETASTPSEPSELVSAPPAAEERATAAPTRQICEPAKPHQPQDREFPTFAEIRDRLDAKFGDTYDRAAVLAAYDKLSEAEWKDANGQPIRDPFRYLASIASAKLAHSQADLEPYPDDETVRIWVEEDCQNGYYDLAAALAARDRLFADPKLRNSLRCGIRAYVVGAARRADAQATVRLAVG